MNALHVYGMLLDRGDQKKVSFLIEEDLLLKVLALSEADGELYADRISEEEGIDRPLRTLLMALVDEGMDPKELAKLRAGQPAYMMCEEAGFGFARTLSEAKVAFVDGEDQNGG